MKNALTRPKAAPTKKDEPEANNAPKPKPIAEPEKEKKDPLAEILAKLGGGFTIEDVKRQYELCGNDEKKTLIILLDQKENDEEMKKRVLFKKLDEAANTKTLNQMTIKPPKATILFEIFKETGEKKASSEKTIKLKHPKLKDVLENFSKPSPDKRINVN